MVLSSRKIFSTTYLTVIFFLLEKGKFKKRRKKKETSMWGKKNFVVSTLREKGILFPVNIFFAMLLHCYANPIEFNFFNFFLFPYTITVGFYLVICTICELSGFCAIK